LVNTKPIPGTEYLGAWIALSYRFLAIAGYDEAFTNSVRTHGDGPPEPERYYQEWDLYGFFVSGLSVIESFCYGLFAIALLMDATKFPTATEKAKKKINPDSTPGLR
jgi:hypothetical protein